MDIVIGYMACVDDEQDFYTYNVGDYEVMFGDTPMVDSPALAPDSPALAPDSHAESDDNEPINQYGTNFGASLSLATPCDVDDFICSGM